MAFDGMRMGIATSASVFSKWHMKDPSAEREAAAAFGAVAGEGGVVGDSVEKILDYGFVAADVGYRRGGGALVGVARNFGDDLRKGIAEIGGDDAIVFEDDGAFGAGDFDAARVAGIRGGGGEERADGSAGEFEGGHGCVFRFDFVQQGGGAGLDANYIAEKPEEQIDGMNGLIDEGSAAVESEGAAPFRGAEIVGWAIPLDASIDQKRLAEAAGVEPLF